jgi:hypothetical protein
MTHFSLNKPVDLFVISGRDYRSRVTTYRRFATGADALQYAIESRETDMLLHSVVDGSKADQISDVTATSPPRR